MQVGGYILDLYCDNQFCIQRNKRFQFVEPTLQRAVREARRVGWVMGPGRELCPCCRPLARSIPVRQMGWFAEYRCGCVSDYSRLKKEVLGYCPTHGENSRHFHKVPMGDEEGEG